MSLGSGISWLDTRHRQSFWPRINCSQIKLPDFESPSGDGLSKSANFGLSKWIFYVKNHLNLSKKIFMDEYLLRRTFFVKIIFSSFKVKTLELVSKELNHFGVIADLFRQIWGHSSRFVLFCSFWRLFTIKMIKSVKVFPFSFWKLITKKIFFDFIKFKPPA